MLCRSAGAASIQELQQKIKDTQNDPTLTPSVRRDKVQLLQSQLMVLQGELLEAQAKSAGSTITGGTAAAGMAQSISGS